MKGSNALLARTKKTTSARKPAKRKAAAQNTGSRPARDGGPRPKAPRTLPEFMAQAWAMEVEASRRYADLADAMETHNNVDVAAMFRTMANYESKHADDIMAAMGWSEAPPITPREDGWPGHEAPEVTPMQDVHYLMQPYHALELALAAEQRAERFFAELARVATTEAVRRAALELRAEEREHVQLVRAWMKKVPKPDHDWADDPDPPRYSE
jgi:rubrerythrin